MRIGSLFSGIGGLELGLARALAPLGAYVAWQVELDPWCREVLAMHFPEADRSVIDVHEASPETLSEVDLICGGFPCQDVSVAGRGAGLNGARSGLWREFLRVVDECSPGWVVVENVASGKARWLCQVRSDLHALGYGTRAYALSAADVGAPHRRARIFVVADAYSEPLRQRTERQPGRPSDGVRNEGSAEPRHDGSEGMGRRAESRLGGGSDGFSSGVDVAPKQPAWPARRGLEQHPWEPPRAIPARRRDHAARLTALGNAVVPAQAEAIGRYILATL